jgi:predicted transcriptional regulator
MTKEELKKWRVEHKVSQQELADFLGVYQESVARWEIGTRKIPSFLHLALLGLEKSKMKGGERSYGLRKKKKE